MHYCETVEDGAERDDVQFLNPGRSVLGADFDLTERCGAPAVAWVACV